MPNRTMQAKVVKLRASRRKAYYKHRKNGANPVAFSQLGYRERSKSGSDPAGSTGRQAWLDTVFPGEIHISSERNKALRLGKEYWRAENSIGLQGITQWKMIVMVQNKVRTVELWFAADKFFFVEKKPERSARRSKVYNGRKEAVAALTQHAITWVEAPPPLTDTS